MPQPWCVLPSSFLRLVWWLFDFMCLSIAHRVGCRILALGLRLTTKKGQRSPVSLHRAVTMGGNGARRSGGKGEGIENLQE